MSGLKGAVGWTRRIGYQFPQRLFHAALCAKYKDLSGVEIEHCESEWERCNAEWARRVEGLESERFAGGGTEAR